MKTLVSLYSGCGGLDIGFHNAGFQNIFATDYWNVACNTLEHAGISQEVVCADIREIDFSSILLKNKLSHIDCLIGGPPCPPYSQTRHYLKHKKTGMEDVDFGFTLPEYFRAVEELKPNVFLFENVDGFMHKLHTNEYEYLKIKSKELGYNIRYEVVNTANYGVPQKRKRFICIGVKKNLPEFVFPKPTHADPLILAKTNDDKLLPWLTCGDVLNDIDFELPEDKDLQGGSKHKDLLKIIPPGENYLFFTEKRGYSPPIFEWKSRYWTFLLKLSPSLPSWTIQASFSNNQGPFHWKNRYLRISEIKRIQSFPDNYEIIGNFQEQWRQIGNAVPPLLAQIFAIEIRKQILNKNEPIPISKEIYA